LKQIGNYIHHLLGRREIVQFATCRVFAVTQSSSYNTPCLNIVRPYRFSFVIGALCFLRRENKARNIISL